MEAFLVARKGLFEAPGMLRLVAGVAICFLLAHAAAQQVAVGFFGDALCQSPNPSIFVTSPGTCYTSQLPSFQFSLATPNSFQAELHIGCSSAVSASASFGSCIAVPGQGFWMAAYPVNASIVFTATEFNGPCQQNATGMPFSFASGQCVQQQNNGST